ncbi:MFS family permease [Anaerotaenia torta]|uniref:MFS transporter n=1 Tax=Anaerotaenia torta TaxID=433293 RepID=UPI003D1BE56C
MSYAKEKQYVRKPDNVFITFIIIYLFFMSARALFNPFITVYLQEKGLGAEKIGLVMGANSLVLILAQPFWGIISDKLRSVKLTLVICMLLQGIMALSLRYCNAFLMISALFCLYSFFSSPEGPLLDTWCLKSLKENGLRNGAGQMKFLGCFGYAAFSIASGYIINKYNTDRILPVFAAVLFLLALFFSRVKTNAQAEKAVPFRELHLERVFKDTGFLLFLPVIFLMQLPHRAAYTFYPLLISSLGGDKMMVGYTSAVMFASEGICMFASRRMLDRFKARTVIMISAVFFLLWQFMYSIASLPWHVAAIALLDGPSYAFFTLGVLYYLDERAPVSVRTTYQTITYGVYFGLSGIAGNNLGGMIISKLGFQAMYRLGAITIGISIIFLYILGRKTNGEKQESNRK